MPSRESDERIDVAGPTALGDAVAATRRYALKQGLGEVDSARLCLIVEEIVTNLCEHGVCDLDYEISVELGHRLSAIDIRIEDNGEPFDPRLASLEVGPPERGGGAGLRLVRSWAEMIGYESNDGRNRLQLIMPLAG